ncbi:RcnB family protein [Sphingomonas sp. IC4-52]|nr:RcnB family protein [Sphingomonas sp. IC4-52]
MQKQCSWHKGERFDRRYAQNYRTIDYRQYRSRHLYAPARSQQQVRSGNDAVLVAVSSGIVAAALANALRWRLISSGFPVRDRAAQAGSIVSSPSLFLDDSRRGMARGHVSDRPTKESTWLFTSTCSLRARIWHKRRWTRWRKPSPRSSKIIRARSSRPRPGACAALLIAW